MLQEASAPEKKWRTNIPALHPTAGADDALSAFVMKQLRAKDKPRHGAWFELMIEISKINNLHLFAIYAAENCWGVFTDPTDGPGTEGVQA